MPTAEYNKTGKITELKPNQVFVFGSNATGFHGAGSAGQAMRGDAQNTWRTDRAFQKAMNAPSNHPDRIGKWAVYGVARGHQIGREGQSYAIETIRRPKMRRSTPLSEIKAQFADLIAFAKKHPELEILMTPVGCGYSGYTAAEMGTTWGEAIKTAGGLPPNIRAESVYQTTPDVQLT